MAFQTFRRGVCVCGKANLGAQWAFDSWILFILQEILKAYYLSLEAYLQNIDC